MLMRMQLVEARPYFPCHLTGFDVDVAHLAAGPHTPQLRPRISILDANDSPQAAHHPGWENAEGGRQPIAADYIAVLLQGGRADLPGMAVG